jgi:hypothetical protein
MNSQMAQQSGIRVNSPLQSKSAGLKPFAEMDFSNGWHQQR